MPKLFFPEGMGGVQNSSGNSGGVGSYFSGQEMEIPGRMGAYVKFLPWWGCGYFWSYTFPMMHSELFSPKIHLQGL